MTHFIFNCLRLCALLLLFATNTVWAQIQESPLDTQILPVGQMFSLIIKGDGESATPALISAEGLPPESVFLRNLDGSRTFMWIPDNQDVGTNSFLVTIADSSDALVFATYPINLEVIDPDPDSANKQTQRPIETTASTEGVSPAPKIAETISDETISDETIALNTNEQVNELTDNKSTDSVTAKTQSSDANNLPAKSGSSAIAANTDKHEPVLVDSSASTTSTVSTIDSTEIAATTNTTTAEAIPATAQLHTAAVVDIATGGDSATASQTAIADSTTTDPTAEETPAESLADNTDLTALARGTAAKEDSDALGSDVGASADKSTTDETIAPVYPELSLPERVTVVVNNELTVPLLHGSDTGNATHLSAVNLPQGARLSETPNGHILVWTPGSNETGSTAIILTVTDAADASLATTRRLAIEVIR